MINVAIDGPSGSGKSTVAKIISKQLNILHLDTGAMYRACALKAYRLGISCDDELGVSAFINDIDLKIEYVDGTQHTLLDGQDVSQEIRKNEMSMLSSKISALSCVRKKMVQMQQKVASENDCILDGRDICAYVLPNAKYKFFVTANAEERANRRHKELLQKGQQIDYQTLLQQIIERDYNDSHREFSPLKQAEDALFIDTSSMTAEQVADYIIEKIKVGENLQ